MSEGRPGPEIQEDKLPLPQSSIAAHRSTSQIDQQTCDQLPPPEPDRVPPLLLTGSKIEDRGLRTEQTEPPQSEIRNPPCFIFPAIPGYEILGELGHGGMGVVYQARQVSLGRVVALKMIRSADLASRADLARFQSEAETVARLKHPNIVAIYEVGEWRAGDVNHPVPYFSLEYVEGGTLAQKVRGVPQPSRSAAEMVEILARAVYAAHQCGIIHRDLKPANVLLTTDGVPKISDFGLAKRLDSSLTTHPSPGTPHPALLTQTGAVMGTPSYMAPEQAAGKTKELGPAADIYSLGAILYELCTGRPPFLAESPGATRELVLTTDPLPPRRLQPKLPRDLQTICLKCLDKEPHRRFPSAEALAADLRRYLDGKPITSRPVGAPERLWRWTRRNPKLALATNVAAAAMMAAVIGFASLMLYRSRTSREAQLKAAEAQLKAAKNALDQGLALCERGEIGQGMLWFARSLELAPEDAENLNRAVRLNLAAWGRQVSPLQAILPHQGKVLAVAFSPDGKTIATGCDDGAANLWKTASGKLLLRIPISDKPILAVAFSPDGKTMLTGGMDDSIARLWDVATGRPIAQLKQLDETSAPSFSIYAVAFSPKGETAVTGCGNDPDSGHAQVWNVRTSQPIIRLDHKKPVRCVAFSPDGRLVVTGGEDETAKLWDSTTGELLKSLPHEGWVMAVTFSPDSKTVLTGTMRGALHFWETATGRLSGKALSQQANLTALALSPDGKAILATSDDRRAGLWDEASGNLIGLPLLHADRIYAAAFSPDGRSILTGGGDHLARLWEVASGKSNCLILPHDNWVPAVAFSPDGTKVLTGSFDTKARLWDAATGRKIAELPHKGQVISVAFGPDGNTVVTGAGELGKERGYAQLWRVKTGAPIGQPLFHKEMVSSVAFSPVDKIVLTAGLDGIAQLWNAQTGQPLGPALKHNSGIMSAALSPNGELVLTGTSGGTAHIWETLTGKAYCQPLRHEGKVYAVAFSPDGKEVLTGSKDHKARLWTTNGDLIGRPWHHDGAVRAVAFSPDVGSALTGSEDHFARLWDTTTGEVIGKPLRHQGAVYTVAFSRCGKFILTGSQDGSARLWDAGTSTAIGPPFRQQGGVRALAFSRDGSTLVTAGGDKKARLWKLALPIEGTIERILCWSGVITGMNLDNEGVVHPLDPQAWNEQSQDLLRQGGPLWP